ncbi:CocE/NonD family hydrolase [Acidicapsa dinghuensis]|uniref:CocE/NonD family hydrolase n=1 Tax=Acidicapsa dinghuensis TaxID=2218256 RepID=A0ABW1EBK6_9BACT|nr:CocE/NonD family hydrolase [Acidicapsa dinghuensis]
MAQGTPDATLDQVSGEYTNTSEPDTPLSFYAKSGKLYVESERHVPGPLAEDSTTEFHLPDTKITYRFTSDAEGKKLVVSYGDGSSITLRRTGNAVRHVFHHYERREAMIPMRDGIKLHVVILTPIDIPGPLPILMQRTPYGVDGASEAGFFAGRPELARDGYIYVEADIRGRYKSEGQFVMCRPLADHRDPKAIDESTDTYDTIAWLLKNIPNNNGRVGVLGTSYPGFLAMMAGIDPHPAVKAISPQAPMIDTWMGDDFFHNGAFRQTYGYDYAMGLESSKENTDVSYGKDADGKPRDGFEYFLDRGSFAEDVKRSGVKKELPTWEAFLHHPAYDNFWYSRGVEHHLNTVTVPTLSVGGYYDQEDMWGPQEEYASLEPHDTKHENFLVLGPWRHGSWSSSSRHLGALQYGEPIGKEYRAQIEAKFFGHYLKDEPGFDLEDTASFQTGSNTWHRYAHFPPSESKPTAFDLCGDGSISVGSPCAATGKISYVSDPANPVPYRHRPIQPTYSEDSQWFNWMLEDQRFVTGRKDVALWKMPIPDHDVTITGEVIADIYAATTGSDGDFVAKLIDQYPDDDPDPTMRGYQLMTNMEIFRGRYRTSFEHPEALKPGAMNEFKWSLHDVDHVFKKGHTILVEIQSTWFPLYDRNPQTFVPNIMTARPEDYKAETISIIAGPAHASKILLPVMP